MSFIPSIYSDMYARFPKCPRCGRPITVEVDYGEKPHTFDAAASCTCGWGSGVKTYKKGGE